MVYANIAILLVNNKYARQSTTSITWHEKRIPSIPEPEWITKWTPVALLTITPKPAFQSFVFQIGPVGNQNLEPIYLVQTVKSRRSPYNKFIDTKIILNKFCT